MLGRSSHRPFAEGECQQELGGQSNDMIGTSQKVVFGKDPIHTNCTVFTGGAAGDCELQAISIFGMLCCSPDSVGLQMGQLYSLPLVGQIIELGLEPSRCGSVVKSQETSTELFQGFRWEVFNSQCVKVPWVEAGKIIIKGSICRVACLDALISLCIQNDVVYLDPVLILCTQYVFFLCFFTWNGLFFQIFL